MKNIMLLLTVLLFASGCGQSTSEKHALAELAAAKLKIEHLSSQLSDESTKVKKVELERLNLEAELRVLSAKLSASEATRDAAIKANEQKADSTRAEWIASLERILLALERVTKEENTFYTAVSSSDFANEERRLTSLAREQEATARGIVSELRLKRFPDSEKVEKDVKDFIWKYASHVFYTKMAMESLKTHRKINKELQEKSEAMDHYVHYHNIRGIRDTFKNEHAK